jgi:hypothetical protein
VPLGHGEQVPLAARADPALHVRQVPFIELQVAHPMQVIQLSVPFEYVVLLQGSQLPALGP